MIFCLCKKPVHDKYLALLDAGGERKDDEFDISKMIAELRALRFELDILREKTGNKDDEDFDKQNPVKALDLDEIMAEGEEENKVDESIQPLTAQVGVAGGGDSAKVSPVNDA